MTYPRYEIIQGKNNRFYWKLYPKNGRRKGSIVWSMKSYKTKQACENGIDNFKLVINHINTGKYTEDKRITKHTANIIKAGRYIKITGKNNTLLARTKIYKSGHKTKAHYIAENGANKAIKAIKKIYDAPIV